jgi:hypothetical protein
MKRALCIAAACVAFAAGAYARDYTHLDPPTLAVADFEVSMNATQRDAAKQVANKDFYGQLISQALLSVLVQQNAANVVYAPRDGSVIPGAPVYDPGMSTLNSRMMLADSIAAAAYNAAIDKAFADWQQAKDDKGRAAALQAAEKAATEVTAYTTSLEDLARRDDRQVARLYFPTIFKIFDKKYVESALESGTFTVKDLYTKAVGAFNFTDLDFLVLGNVYETKFGTTIDAIGFNVRVLNTKRAEEVYSYSAIINKDLHDLPIACAQICQCIMIDILNSHCAQLKITESAEVAATALSATKSDDKDSSFSYEDGKYLLFWQPSQVEKDDNTVGNSDNSDKRQVLPKIFYWTLPGQYIITVYNRETQQLKEIQFSIAAGEMRNIVVGRGDIETPTGTITVSGIGPTTSYTFAFTPKKLSEQYWWEIFNPPGKHEPFAWSCDNGVITRVQQGRSTSSESDMKMLPKYRYESQDILFSGLNPGAYDITVTRNPPQGLGSISGIWYVSLKEILKSDPLTVTVGDPKDVKLSLDKFGLQEKQLIESPRATKVTFILNPGFGFEGYIDIDDNSSINPTELYWADKEKITIASDYTQDSWNTFPDVTFTVWTYGVSERRNWRTWEKYELRPMKKDQIVPEKDIVVFVDLESLRAAGAKAATEYEKNYDAAVAALAKANQSGSAGQSSQSGQGAALVQPKTGTAPAKTASKLYFTLGVGVGYGSAESYDYSLHRTTTSSGVAATTSAQLYWMLTPTLGLGVGALFDAVIGSGTALGIAGTLDVVLGDISKGVATTVDVGIGTGFTAGVGLIFPNAKSKGGLTMGIDYFMLSSASWSISFNFGALF